MERQKQHHYHASFFGFQDFQAFSEKYEKIFGRKWNSFFFKSWLRNKGGTGNLNKETHCVHEVPKNLLSELTKNFTLPKHRDDFSFQKSSHKKGEMEKHTRNGLAFLGQIPIMYLSFHLSGWEWENLKSLSSALFRDDDKARSCIFCPIIMLTLT